MNAAKLREVVELAIRHHPDPLDCTDETCHRAHDPVRCPWLLGVRASDAAQVALANHATALVELVAACERWRCVIGCSCPDDDDAHQLGCEMAQANADIARALDALAKIGADYE